MGRVEKGVGFVWGKADRFVGAGGHEIQGKEAVAGVYTLNLKAIILRTNSTPKMTVKMIFMTSITRE